MAPRRYSQTGARVRRAVILATLTCILFAVAGVTAATESTLTSSSRDGDQTESTVSETTGPERTAPEATVPEDVKKPDEGTVEATVVVHEEPKEPGKGDPRAGNYGGIQDDNRIEEAGEPTGEPTGKPGKPEHARGKKYGKP